MNRKVKSYLSLGSNMGNKLYYLMEALILIENTLGIELTKVSSFYETPPWGYTEQDSFYNIAVEIETTLLPFELLRNLQKIEATLHRKRDVRWGPRTLDIDIIFYDNLKIETNDLKVPHPRYSERMFVLAPLYEIYSKNYKLTKYLRGDREGIKKVMPKVLISSCLLGENCTYKGSNNYKKVFDVITKVRYLDICPEVEGGLSIPRVPSERRGNKVIDKNGIDVTREFFKGAEKALEVAISESCDLAILKAKSPSCGKGSVYDGSFSKTLIKGNGVTSELLEKNGIKIIAV